MNSNHNSAKYVKLILILVAAVLIICSGIGGYLLGINQTKGKENGRRLLIDATVNESAGYATIGSEKNISYSGLSDVTISIGGKTVTLEKALYNGDITAEEIAAFARIDAGNNICSLVTESEHGLAQFIYRYPEFDLSIVYDIYETPDGEQHLINRMSFCEPNGHREINSSYSDPNSEYLYDIDREDWGLSFEVIVVTSTGITIRCSQSGGQQIGRLIATDYLLFSSETGELITRADGNASAIFSPNLTIAQNESTEIVIDWFELFGMLDSGSYVLKLWVKDEYDEDQLHPLMDNFYDNQYYYIEFSIP